MPFQFGPYTVEENAVSCGAWALARATDAAGQPVRISFLRLPEGLSEDQRNGIGEAMDRSVSRWAAAGAAPGLAGIVESGRMDAGLYLVESSAGATLREAVGAAPLPLADTVGLLQSIAQALEDVHAAGAFHPWLSPDNVVYAGTAPLVAGQPWSEVFAALQAVRPDTPWPDAAFTAPEVLTGAAPDARAEAWSVAAMAAYALTGEDPGRLSESAGLSSSVYAALRRGLCPDPSARQASAREMVVDLTVERAIAVDDQAEQNAVPTGGDVPDWARELLAETTARREAGRPLIDAPTPAAAAPEPAAAAPAPAAAPPSRPGRHSKRTPAVPVEVVPRAAAPAIPSPAPAPDPVPAASADLPGKDMPAPVFEWSGTSHAHRSWVPIAAAVLSVLFVLLGLAVTFIGHR